MPKVHLLKWATLTACGRNTKTEPLFTKASGRPGYRYREEPLKCTAKYEEVTCLNCIQIKETK